jgi:hypothetical protein
MQTTRKIAPGQKVNKKLSDQHGADLVRVRSR